MEKFCQCREKGQGLVEMLLLLIVALFSIFFSLNSCSHHKSWEIKDLIEEKDVVAETLDVEPHPVNNCTGDQAIQSTVEKEVTEEHLVVVERSGGGSIDDGLLHFIKAYLEQKYIVQDKEVIRNKKQYQFTTSPHTYNTYRIVWKYTWKKGKFNIEYADGRTEEYFFGVQKQLIGEIETQNIPCPP